MSIKVKGTPPYGTIQPSGPLRRSPTLLGVGGVRPSKEYLIESKQNAIMAQQTLLSAAREVLVSARADMLYSEALKAIQKTTDEHDQRRLSRTIDTYSRSISTYENNIKQLKLDLYRLQIGIGRPGKISIKKALEKIRDDFSRNLSEEKIKICWNFKEVGCDEGVRVSEQSFSAILNCLIENRILDITDLSEPNEKKIFVSVEKKDEQSLIVQVRSAGKKYLPEQGEISAYLKTIDASFIEGGENNETVFELDFPCTEPDNKAEIMDDIKQKRDNYERARKINVFLIAPGLDFRGSTENALKNMGFQVYAFADPADAAVRMEEITPKIVVLDEYLGWISAAEAIGKMKERYVAANYIVYGHSSLFPGEENIRYVAKDAHAIKNAVADAVETKIPKGQTLNGVVTVKAIRKDAPAYLFAKIILNEMGNVLASIKANIYLFNEAAEKLEDYQLVTKYDLGLQSAVRRFGDHVTELKDFTEYKIPLGQLKPSDIPKLFHYLLKMDKEDDKRLAVFVELMEKCWEDPAQRYKLQVVASVYLQMGMLKAKEKLALLNKQLLPEGVMEDMAAVCEEAIRINRGLSGIGIDEYAVIMARLFSKLEKI